MSSRVDLARVMSEIGKRLEHGCGTWFGPMDVQNAFRRVLKDAGLSALIIIWTQPAGLSVQPRDLSEPLAEALNELAGCQLWAGDLWAALVNALRFLFGLAGGVLIIWYDPGIGIRLNAAPFEGVEWSSN